MTPTLLRFADLKARGIVNNRQTLSDWIEKYEFPAGRMLAPNTRAWTDEEIANWIANRPAEPKSVAQTLTNRHVSRRRKSEAA